MPYPDTETLPLKLYFLLPGSQWLNWKGLEMTSAPFPYPSLGLGWFPTGCSHPQGAALIPPSLPRALALPPKHCRVHSIWRRGRTRRALPSFVTADKMLKLIF